MENNDKKNESGLEWEFKGRPNPREIEAEDVTPDLGKTVIDTKADGQIKELKTLTEQKPEQKSEQKPEQKPERSPELIVEINKIVADRFKNSDSEAIQYHQRLSGYWSLLMLAFIAALLAVVVTRYVHYTSVAQSEVESAALEESAKSLARTISERKLTSELLGYGSYLKTIDRKDLAERYPELVPPPKSSNTTDSALLDLDSLINRYTISDTICDASRMRGTQIESEIVGLSPKVAEELKKIGNNTSTSMSQLVEILGCSGIAPENGVATYASVASAGAYMGNNTIGFTLTDEYPDCAAAVRRMVPDGPMADSIIKITTSYGQSEKQKTKFPDGGTEEKRKAWLSALSMMRN